MFAATYATWACVVALVVSDPFLCSAVKWRSPSGMVYGYLEPQKPAVSSQWCAHSTVLLWVETRYPGAAARPERVTRALTACCRSSNDGTLCMQMACHYMLQLAVTPAGCKMPTHGWSRLCIRTCPLNGTENALAKYCNSLTNSPPSLTPRLKPQQLL